MESNWGALEAELCKFLKVTPRQLGRLRDEDPWGLEFLERYIIHTWKKEHEAYEKMKSKQKVGAVKRRPRRH